MAIWLHSERSEKERAIDRSPDVRTLSYLEAMAMPESKLRRFRLKSWGRWASEIERNAAAVGLQRATDEDATLDHLSLFADRAYPLDPDPLFQLADSAGVLNDYLAEALSNITHEQVRHLAIQFVHERRSGRRHAIRMIDRNFQAGDHERILAWLTSEEDPDILHRMDMDAMRLVDHHPDPEAATEILLAVYEFGPCSFCRTSAVERLLERDSLPDAIRTECAWDCDDQTRDLVAPSPTTG